MTEYMSAPYPSMVSTDSIDQWRESNREYLDTELTQHSISSDSLQKLKKAVSFAKGTAGPKQSVLALSITRFDHLENLGYTEYTIQLYRNGRLWSIQRRYRHFEKLLKDLKKENPNLKDTLPSFPQKRWFEAKRWFNRFEDNYSFDRQIALQTFLRSLIKLPDIMKGSKVLRRFFEMDENEDLTPIDYEPLRDRRILYYEVEEPEDDDSFYSTDSLIRLSGAAYAVETFRGWGSNRLSEYDDSSDGDHSSGQSLEPMLLAVAASLEKTRMQAEVNRIAEASEALSSSPIPLNERNLSEDRKSDSSSDDEKDKNDDNVDIADMPQQISTPTEELSDI